MPGSREVLKGGLTLAFGSYGCGSIDRTDKRVLYPQVARFQAHSEG